MPQHLHNINFQLDDIVPDLCWILSTFLGVLVIFLLNSVLMRSKTVVIR